MLGDDALVERGSVEKADKPRIRPSSVSYVGVRKGVYLSVLRTICVSRAAYSAWSASAWSAGNRQWSGVLSQASPCPTARV